MKLYGAPSSRLFPMAKDGNLKQASNVSHRISKQAKYINKTREGKIYKTNRAGFKEMVQRLTGTTLNSRRLDGLRPSPLAHASSPQPIRLNGAPIPPLPYRYPAAPIRINVVNTSTVELSSMQPPSPPSPPSLSSSLPPPSPREQESMEASVAAFMQYFEDRTTEDDPNQEYFSVWSTLIHLTPTSDKEQQPVNIPPPVSATLPSWNLEWPNYPNNLQSKNIPPTGFGTVPSWNLDLPNYPSVLRSKNFPPPAPTALPSCSLLE